MVPTFFATAPSIYLARHVYRTTDRNYKRLPNYYILTLDRHNINANAHTVVYAHDAFVDEPVRNASPFPYTRALNNGQYMDIHVSVHWYTTISYDNMYSPITISHARPLAPDSALLHHSTSSSSTKSVALCTPSRRTAPPPIVFHNVGTVHYVHTANHSAPFHITR